MDISHVAQYDIKLAFNQEEIKALYDIVTGSVPPKALRGTHDAIISTIVAYKEAIDAANISLQQRLVGGAVPIPTLETANGGQKSAADKKQSH